MNKVLTKNEEVLLTFLKAGLWQKEALFPDEFSDWAEVTRLAKRQSVLGVVAKAILSSSAAAQIPAVLKGKLRSFVVTNAMTSSRMDEVMVSLFNIFKTNGVHSVLLKGRGLAANYPYPELRQCGDIDVYIHRDELHNAYDALEEVADRIDDRSFLDCGKHFTALYEGVDVEIHRYISTHINGKDGERFGRFAKAGLKKNLAKLELGTEEISLPETTFNAFYIFDHLFEHYLTSGVGLRQMSDWMLFLHKNKEGIDKDLLYDILKTMDMLKPWKIFGTVLVDYMGLTDSDFPFYETSDKGRVVMNHILQDGNFGKDTAYYKNRSRTFIGRKLKSFWWHMKRGVKMKCLISCLGKRLIIFTPLFICHQNDLSFLPMNVRLLFL